MSTHPVATSPTLPSNRFDHNFGSNMSKDNYTIDRTWFDFERPRRRLCPLEGDEEVPRQGEFPAHFQRSDNRRHHTDHHFAAVTFGPDSLKEAILVHQGPAHGFYHYGRHHRSGQYLLGGGDVQQQGPGAVFPARIAAPAK